MGDMVGFSSRWLVWAVLLGISGLAYAQESFEDLKLAGAKLYSEKSYALAYETWSKAAELDVPVGDRRKLDFYLADSRWRSRPGEDDVTAAQADLEKLVDSNPDDVIAAEALESLGDSWLALDTNGSHWRQAWEYYERALKKWAAATDLDTARPRYLGIVWKATGPPTEQRYGWSVPIEVLANALEIANDPEQRARAHYFLGAYYWSRGGDPFSVRRAGREWEATLAEGPETAVYEPALFHLAEWNERAGKSEWSPDGGLTISPDYDRALELYRRFLEEFPKGKSQFSDQAQARITEITRPTVEINSSFLYLPDSEPSVVVNWRNVGPVELVAYRVDLAAAFRPSKTTSPDSWIDAVSLDGATEIARWAVGGENSRAQMSEETAVPGTIEAGSYLVVATAGKLTSRALVSVSGSTAIMQTVGSRVIAMVADARVGAAIEPTVATLWQARRNRDNWTWIQSKPVAHATAGVTVFDLPASDTGGWGNLILLGTAGGAPIVVEGQGGYSREQDGTWQIMVYADRAATRPGEPVQWKMIARQRTGGALTTPDGETLQFKIVDPQGNSVNDGEVKLTEFGTAWGEFRSDQKMPLGEYQMEISRNGSTVGGATLFRLEEYRLPEFKVSVGIPAKQNGVRLGDSFDVEIGTEYYFGGGVSDATVKIIVREAPWQRWIPYPDGGIQVRAGSRPARQPGRIIREDELKTGPQGKARIAIETPIDSRNDLEYTVEARVVDATGREVVGTQQIAVSRQGYFVDLTSSRRVVFPKDPVKVAISAEDANGGSVPALGKVTISRERWREVWLNPRGREVEGDELAKWRKDIFPPPGQSGWRVKRRDYDSEEVKRVEVKLNASGEGEVEFTPTEEGFYRIAWSGRDADGPPVTSEINVWAASKDAQLAGYHADGVEIVVDTNVEPGQQTLPVLIATGASGRDVLFTAHAGGELFHSQIVHVDGTAALIDLPVDARFVPNVFLSAALIQNLEFHQASADVTVPPYANRLNVELSSDKTTFLPGAMGTFNVRLSDENGKPVRGEVSLSVIDEAVSAIQEDYAGDPVDFFFGQRRADAARLFSSMSGRRFKPSVESEVGPRAEADDSSAFGFGFGDAMAKGEMMLMESPLTASAAPSPQMRSGAGSGEESPTVTVRSDFRAAALWKPGVETDEVGVASVTMRYPESLTTWLAKARATTRGAEFGFGDVSTQTTKPLVARLQTPRFLVVGDTATIAGVANNRTKGPLSVRAELKLEGLDGSPEPTDLTVNAESSASADWTVQASNPGSAKLALTAVGGEFSDGLAKVIPIGPNGIEVSSYASGKATEADTTINLEIPAERREGSERLTISVTPSLAAAALDAIPYLIEFPYGCTEQTMSRFLPAAVTARTLRDLGLDEAAVIGRMFGGIDPSYLPPIAGDRPGIAELDGVVRAGLNRLASLQRPDGSWPWWGGGQSDAFMTAYVVWGLRQAELAEVPIDTTMTERGARWLRGEIVNAQSDPDLQAWLLHALASTHRPGTKLSNEESNALENLWSKRDALSAYGRALLTLAAAGYGDQAKQDVLVRNLQDGVVLDRQPGVSAATGTGSTSKIAIPTAHWGSDGIFSRWQDAGVEATSFALQALLAADPKNALVEPAMNWLVKNRRGARWSNTRDTAFALLAIDRYLSSTKELGEATSFEVSVNGKPVGKVDKATALEGMPTFDVDPELIEDETNEIVIRRTAGDSPLYVAAEAVFFSLEEPIPARGNEIFLKRQYSLYEPKLTLLDGYRFDRVPWKNNSSAIPNSRVEVKLTLEAKNDLQYVIVEDLKPAGLEAVQVKSGLTLTATHSDGSTEPIYCELRDRKVALFASRLKQGVWTIHYDLRAETPGDFSALPVTGHAMYAPEVRANGTSRRVQIGE